MKSKFRSFLYNEQTAVQHLKVASVAMACDRDLEINKIKIASMMERIKTAHPDVNLVFFGEMILGWYKPGELPAYHRQISEPVSLEALQTFVSLAVKHEIYLCFGLSEMGEEALYNTQVLLNPRGEIQAVHRKWNLKSGEKAANYRPGPVPVTITEINGVRTGILICSDASTPTAMWELMKSRLDLILLSLADDRDDDRFMARFNARMYDAWIVTANRYGDEDGRFWNGHIVVSDPCGELRATGQDQEQVLVYDLQFAAPQSGLRRFLRNVWVKTPLIFHILRNWKKVRSYF